MIVLHFLAEGRSSTSLLGILVRFVDHPNRCLRPLKLLYLGWYPPFAG